MTCTANVLVHCQRLNFGCHGQRPTGVGRASVCLRSHPETFARPTPYRSLAVAPYAVNPLLTVHDEVIARVELEFEKPEGFVVALGAIPVFCGDSCGWFCSH